MPTVLLKVGMIILMLAAAPVVAQAGTLEGVAIGAGTGAVVAGPPGAVVGGVVGAVVGGWQDQSGLAAIYSDKSGKTMSGEEFKSDTMTAAHRSLPFGTMVRVTNTQNGRSIVVRINDRGPFTRGRVIDVTPAAARALGFSGLAPVKLSLAAP